MMSPAGACRRSLALAVIVVSVLVTWPADVSAVNDQDESPVVDDVDRVLTSPLFDVGRLWLRAIVRQARRVVDGIQLTLTSTVAKLVFVIVAAFLLARLYRFFFLPIDRVKLLGDVGYVDDGRRSMKDVAAVSYTHLTLPTNREV